MFEVKEPSEAIRCYSGWGPTFGQCDCLKACLKGDGFCVSNVGNDTFGYTEDKDGKSLLTGSKDYFIANEVEVFNVV